MSSPLVEKSTSKRRYFPGGLQLHPSKSQSQKYGYERD